jgi:hypothetical protein
LLTRVREESVIGRAVKSAGGGKISFSRINNKGMSDGERSYTETPQFHFRMLYRTYMNTIQCVKFSRIFVCRMRISWVVLTTLVMAAAAAGQTEDKTLSDSVLTITRALQNEARVPGILHSE